MARTKSILTEARQIEARGDADSPRRAAASAGKPRPTSATSACLRLYKEVAGKSPSKGQLPFSTDWFMTWQPNIHSAACS